MREQLDDLIDMAGAIAYGLVWVWVFGSLGWGLWMLFGWLS